MINVDIYHTIVWETPSTYKVDTIVICTKYKKKPKNLSKYLKLAEKLTANIDSTVFMILYILNYV